MLKPRNTRQFEKDYKLIVKQGKDTDKLTDVMEQLIREVVLDKKFKDHKLTGGYVGHRECHIEPDWLLIYHKSIKENVITFVRTGSHSDLFE